MLSFTVHVNLKLITTTCLVNFLYTAFLNCTVLTSVCELVYKPEARIE